MKFHIIDVNVMLKLRTVARRIGKRKVQHLGRWDTRRSEAIKMKIGHMADHDGCGALTCAAPPLQKIEDVSYARESVDGEEWLIRHHFAISADPPAIHAAGAGKKHDSEE